MLRAKRTQLEIELTETKVKAAMEESEMTSTKENGRLRGRLLFCVLEPGVHPKRELQSNLTQALTAQL